MQRLLTSIGILATVVAYGPAVAADLRIPRPAQQAPAQQAASSNWSGGQVGGNGGGSIANNAFVEPGSYLCLAGFAIGSNCYETPFSFSDKKASAVGGGFIGYRWQFGNYVAGIEGDVLFQKATTSSALSYVCPPGFGGACGPGGASRTDRFSGSVTQGVEGSIRGRYGVLITPATLLYATGGVSFMEAKGSYAYIGTQFGNTAYAANDWSKVLVGGTVGAGVETELFPRVKVRGEYRFTHYGSYSKDVPVTSVCPFGCGTSSSSAHININDIYNHKFLLGIGWDLGVL